jgi:hypothetical protein
VEIFFTVFHDNSASLKTSLTKRNGNSNLIEHAIYPMSQPFRRDQGTNSSLDFAMNLSNRSREFSEATSCQVGIERNLILALLEDHHLRFAFIPLGFFPSTCESAATPIGLA